jgi:hypothetical protein
MIFTMLLEAIFNGVSGCMGLNKTLLKSAGEIA